MTVAVVLLLTRAAAAAPAPPPHSHADPREPAPAGLRPLRGWIGQLIADARPVSPTLDRLARRAEARPVIVYVDEMTSAAAEWDGRLSFIGAAGGYCYLRIELRRLPAAKAAAVLAHELQHVLEVMAAAVSSPADFETLYERIGIESPGRRYDTLAAMASGSAAMRELANIRRRPAPAR